MKLPAIRYVAGEWDISPLFEIVKIPGVFAYGTKRGLRKSGYTQKPSSL